MKLKWKLTLSAKLEILKYAAAVILVMVTGALIIFSQGNSPVEAFRAMIIGSVGSPAAIGTTIRWATPSIITGIAAVVALNRGSGTAGLRDRCTSALCGGDCRLGPFPCPGFTYPGLPVDRWFGGYGLRVYPGDSEIEAAGQ